MDQGITVRGNGRVERTPDIAVVTLGATAQALAASEAHAQAAVQMREILAMITAAGIPARDTTTDQVRITQTFDWSGDVRRPTGYEAVQSATVRVRDLSKLGPLIDSAVGVGGNRVSNVRLGLEDASEALLEARTLAVQDALRAAETLAAAAGVRVGLPVAIRDEPVHHLEGRMYAMSAWAASAAQMPETPISAGQTVVEATVEVTYALL